MTWYKLFVWYHGINASYNTELGYQCILKPSVVETSIENHHKYTIGFFMNKVFRDYF